MSGFFYSTVILLSAAAEHGTGGGGFTEFYNTWLNYPGFEAWKFLNLFLFVGLLVYLVKTPLTDAFKARRDAIRAELIRAEEAKQSALSRLTSAEAKLAGLESERAALQRKAAEEAEAEKRRIAEQTESEAGKLQTQTAEELSRLQKQVVAQLRRFSADESVRLAEAKLRAKMDSEKDSRLVKSGIASIGGVN